MTEVHVSIHIDRPAEEVFAVLADMEQNPRWQAGQKRCTWTSEPPLRLGSTYDQEAEFLFRDIVSSFEVVEFEPGRRIRIVSTGGTMPIDVTREVVSVAGGGCEVSAVVKGEPPGAFRLLGPLVDRMVRSRVTADYRTLKQLMES
ncbi:MAG: SRPBCC family protein [Actinomycetota bacterium]